MEKTHELGKINLQQARKVTTKIEGCPENSRHLAISYRNNEDMMNRDKQYAYKTSGPERTFCSVLIMKHMPQAGYSAPSGLCKCNGSQDKLSSSKAFESKTSPPIGVAKSSNKADSESVKSQCFDRSHLG